MATNKTLNPPPLFLAPVNDQSKVTTDWGNWFNDLHYLNSEKNHQYLTAAGKVNLDAEYVNVTKSGAGTYAITLDAPTEAGRLKIITMSAVSGGGTVTMSLSNCIGGTASTTCTWDAVNDTLIMISITTKWVIIKQHGVTLT